jgi:hypothetical protein
VGEYALGSETRRVMDLVSFILKNSLNIKNSLLFAVFFKYSTKENFQKYIQTKKHFRKGWQIPDGEIFGVSNKLSSYVACRVKP